MLGHPAPSDAKASSPLSDVAAQTVRVAEICDLLEALADDLPRRSAPVWKETTRMCRDLIEGHYQLLLGSLLPILARRTKDEVECQDVLTRLGADFDDEVSRLTELNVLMTDAVGEHGSKIGSEALGYALRCFFGSLRRSTIWETEVLLPLAERRLTTKDLQELADALPLLNGQRLQS
ncbi:MAG: hypothetical protein AAF231_01390 [Pseudomonadota bacterium]